MWQNVSEFFTSGNFFKKLCNEMACIGGKKHRGWEEDDEEVISGLPITLAISFLFRNSPLLVCLLGPDSSN